METDYSKHANFRWKVKWRLERLSALGIMVETAPLNEVNSLSGLGPSPCSSLRPPRFFSTLLTTCSPLPIPQSTEPQHPGRTGFTEIHVSWARSSERLRQAKGRHRTLSPFTQQNHHEFNTKLVLHYIYSNIKCPYATSELVYRTRQTCQRIAY